MKNVEAPSSGRKRTGSLVPAVRDGRKIYRCRLRLRDGSRPWFDVPEGMSEARAREWVASQQEKEDVRGEIFAARSAGVAVIAPRETYAEWVDRWLAERDARGLTSVSSDKSRIKQHVTPVLGTRPMLEITRAEIEALVTRLDSRVRAGELSWKNAHNVWGLVTRQFADAHSSKQTDLRVAREDNPTTGVRGPDRGARKAKQFLWPSEFEALISCRVVPLRYRVLYAAAVYTFARAGELEALTWADVDLEHNVIHITKAVDRHSGKVKATKTGETRRIPIEPELHPLLVACAGKPDEKCFWLPADETRANALRRHLRKGGVSRGELFSGDLTRKQITFHDLRATGITWMAVRGDDPLKIMQRAGHSDFKTTQGYIRQAENLSHGFGDVFPTLPKSLFNDPDWSKHWSKSEGVDFHLRDLVALSQRREGDSNPWYPCGHT